MSDATTRNQQVVLVTGASTGFGRLTVETLARRGHTVFAAVRDVSGRNATAAAELAAVAQDETLDLHVVELDVTDQDSADRAISAVLDGAGRIDVVVNNAGVTFPGPLEAFTADEALRQFDVNAVGALRVNRAALPHLRGQGHGLLLQVGSVGGRVTLPYVGLYCAGKAALESLTDAWHYELAPFGVESVIVEPATYPTNLGVNAAMAADAERAAVYAEGFGGFFTAVTERSAEVVGDPQVVADAVVALVETPDGKRPRRTVIGPDDQYQPVHQLNRDSEKATLAVGTATGVAAFMTTP